MLLVIKRDLCIADEIISAMSFHLELCYHKVIQDDEGIGIDARMEANYIAMRSVIDSAEALMANVPQSWYLPIMCDRELHVAPPGYADTVMKSRVLTQLLQQSYSTELPHDALDIAYRLRSQVAAYFSPELFPASHDAVINSSIATALLSSGTASHDLYWEMIDKIILDGERLLVESPSPWLVLQMGNAYTERAHLRSYQGEREAAIVDCMRARALLENPPGSREYADLVAVFRIYNDMRLRMLMAQKDGLVTRQEVLREIEQQAIAFVRTNTSVQRMVAGKIIVEEIAREYVDCGMLGDAQRIAQWQLAMVREWAGREDSATARQWLAGAYGARGEIAAATDDVGSAILCYGIVMEMANAGIRTDVNQRVAATATLSHLYRLLGDKDQAETWRKCLLGELKNLPGDEIVAVSLSSSWLTAAERSGDSTNLHRVHDIAVRGGSIQRARFEKEGGEERLLDSARWFAIAANEALEDGETRTARILCHDGMRSLRMAREEAPGVCGVACELVVNIGKCDLIEGFVDKAAGRLSFAEDLCRTHNLRNGRVLRGLSELEYLVRRAQGDAQAIRYSCVRALCEDVSSRMSRSINLALGAREALGGNESRYEQELVRTGLLDGANVAQAWEAISLRSRASYRRDMTPSWDTTEFHRSRRVASGLLLGARAISTRIDAVSGDMETTAEGPRDSRYAFLPRRDLASVLAPEDCVVEFVRVQGADGGGPGAYCAFVVDRR
ncbi:MAG: hypothetical protein FJ297_06710, partial [Planctomycetes bacterium]|nr:hypothetical protein [Planctomycetota bacterium]